MITAGALLSAACGDGSGNTNGSGGGGGTNASSSSSSSSTSSSSSGGMPGCTPSFAISGMAGGQIIDRTYCSSYHKPSSEGGWMDVTTYIGNAPTPTNGAVSVLWGDGALSATTPALGGILELPDEDQGLALRLCLGPVTRDAKGFSTTSLSTLGTCPGQPTDDTLTAYWTFHSSYISGKLVGQSVSDGLIGLGCSGTLCRLDLDSGGAIFLRLDIEPGLPPVTAGIVEAYVRWPGQSAMTVLCGSNASSLEIGGSGYDMTYSLELAGLTSLATCPGTPVEGQVSGTKLMP